MISLLVASLFAAAPAHAQAEQTHFRMCVESCVALNERPSWELRQCLDQCARLYLPKPIEANAIVRQCNPEETQCHYTWPL